MESFTIEENEIESGEVFYSPMKGELLKCGIDPRSPTTEFYRTPILLNTSKNNLLLNSSEDNIEVFHSPVVANTKVLGLDPRSPTNEFVRTPIVISTSNDNLLKVLHNKNLDKVIQSEICTTPTYKKEIITPKLLGSSPIKKRNDAYKRKSFVGLLETNIDFTETDIDAVLKEKCRIKDNESDAIFDSDMKKKDDKILPNEVGNKLVIELKGNVDNAETKEDFNTLPNHTNLENEVAFETQSDFNLNEVVDILVNESKDIVNVKIEECLISKEEVLLERTTEKLEESGKSINEVPLESKSAPLTPRKNISQLNSAPKSAPVTPPLVNITADVKELDKKLTNLIYEDQDIVVCPRIVQLKDVLERSPLRNRNKIESDIRKSAQKLKVSDKPRKSDFAVSKIPVFKTTAKSKIQCENTPPRNMETKTKNTKKTKWDNNDVTLYL